MRPFLQSVFPPGKYAPNGVYEGDYKWSKPTHRTRPFEVKYISHLPLRLDYNCISNDGIVPSPVDY